MPPYDTECRVAQSLVDQAGQLIHDIVERGFDVHMKPDGSQVTTADLEVDHFLRHALLEKFPDDGWLSEETPDDGERLHQPRVWILDPIDGTRNFVEHIPYYAVSLALVDAGSLVLGIIYNPATNERFVATHGGGAWLNDAPIHVRDTAISPFTLLANLSPQHQAAVYECEPNAVIHSFGSIAYALALVAEGRADATLYRGRQNEWDLAAGTLLIQEAGGIAVDQAWQPIRYNQPHTSIPGIVGTHPHRAATLKSMLQSIAR